MKKWRRWLLALAGLFVLILTLAFIFISPIAKYLIEKYDVEFIGREITMNKIFLNLFSGTASIKNFVVYEKDGKTPFFKANRLHATISIYKVLRDKYDISNISAESPALTIIRTGEHFNYDDILDRILVDGIDDTTTSNEAPTQYWIRNIDIKDLSITYINTRPYNKVGIQKGNVIVPLIAWDDPVYNLDCGFTLTEGGNIVSKTNYNDKTGLFTLNLQIDKFNCSVLFPYLKDYIQVTSLEGLFSTTINISGNANKPEEVAAGGLLTLEKFSVVDNTKEKLLACEKLEIKVDSINTKGNIYDFNTVSLKQPYIKFAMYDDGFNYERLMKTSAATSTAGISDESTSYSNVFVSASEYLDEIVREYVISNYNADQLLISDGSLVFTDYTLEDKFQYQFDSINVLSDRINSNNKRIAFELSSQLNKTGNLKGSLFISPDNFKDVEMELAVSKLKVTDFNPYSVYYVATPFLDGNVFYNNKTTIHSRMLSNKNDFNIYNMKAGKKVKNKTAKKVPVRLAVSLLKDAKGEIHIKFPVSGSLDDPKFKWGTIVWQVLKNMMGKVVAAPYKLLAGKFGGNETDYKEILFDYELKELTEKQIKQLDQLVAVLQKDSALQLELVQLVNSQDETEWLATQYAKRRFLNISDTIMIIGKEQQLLINNLSLRDSAFIAFIDQRVGPTRLQSIQDKCIQFIGKEKIDQWTLERRKLRDWYITGYFVKTKKVDPSRIIFTKAKGKEPLSRNEPPKYLVNVAIAGEEVEEVEKEKN